MLKVIRSLNMVLLLHQFRAIITITNTIVIPTLFKLNSGCNGIDFKLNCPQFVIKFGVAGRGWVNAPWFLKKLLLLIAPSDLRNVTGIAIVLRLQLSTGYCQFLNLDSPIRLFLVSFSSYKLWFPFKCMQCH